MKNRDYQPELVSVGFVIDQETRMWNWMRVFTTPEAARAWAEKTAAERSLPGKLPFVARVESDLEVS